MKNPGFTQDSHNCSSKPTNYSLFFYRHGTKVKVTTPSKPGAIPQES